MIRFDIKFVVVRLSSSRRLPLLMANMKSDARVDVIPNAGVEVIPNAGVEVILNAGVGVILNAGVNNIPKAGDDVIPKDAMKRLTRGARFTSYVAQILE